ncbi:UPF0606 protein, partial [Lates japonicus]
GFRFTQLPDMGIGSPPPLIPSRPGPPPGTSLRRSTPDVSLKPRVSEASDLQAQQHNGTPYLPLSRTPFPAVTVDQSITTYSGNPITAVYAISANRPGYSDYFVMSPPSSYRSPSWMSYPPEPEDLPRQWNDTPNSQTAESLVSVWMGRGDSGALSPLPHMSLAFLLFHSFITSGPPLAPHYFQLSLSALAQPPSIPSQPISSAAQKVFSFPQNSSAP